MSEILFTMDVEDPDQDRDGGFVSPLLSVLDWLAKEQRRGTFFVVGALAEQYPEAVRRISEAGHEIGLHGWQHVDIGSIGERRFRRHITRGKALLEDLTGAEVHGFRAPMFSLTEQTIWAEAAIKEAGFHYSSSVLPANNPRFSFPGKPQQIFTWPSGLIEVPAPVTVLGGVEMPFLGGIYFRYLPNWYLKLAHSRLGACQVPWFYCHPYDFYWDKAYIRMKQTPLWVNLLIMGRRRYAMQKMRRFFKSYKTDRTMSEFVESYIA